MCVVCVIFTQHGRDSGYNDSLAMCVYLRQLPGNVKTMKILTKHQRRQFTFKPVALIVIMFKHGISKLNYDQCMSLIIIFFLILDSFF